jgi:hypothetical protein
MRRNAALWMLASATILLSACIDLSGPGRDFEGFYSYAGTVEEAFGDAVLGTLTVTRQRGNTALVTIDWSYIDDGVESVRITTDRAAEGTITSGGWIEFEFTGDLSTSSGVVPFELLHAGRLRGNTISGTWDLFTDLPTTDRGSFIAER